MRERSCLVVVKLGVTGEIDDITRRFMQDGKSREKASVEGAWADSVENAPREVGPHHLAWARLFQAVWVCGMVAEELGT